MSKTISEGVNEFKDLTEEEIKKIEDLRKKVAIFFENVNSSNLIGKKERVGWILNHFPSTRNSDISCLIKYWQTFESELLEDKNTVKLANLYNLTTMNSVTRIRAKIQNEYKLFLASDKIRKHRGTLEEETRDWAIKEQPDYPVYSVYIDESGKTDKYLIVGSLWIIEPSITLKIFQKMKELKETYKNNYELHFKKINRSNIHIYNNVLELIKENSSSLGFKAISVERSGNKNINDTLTKMMYYLITDGIEHENITGRAPLPRILQVTKDQEEKGSDKILLREIKDRIDKDIESKFDGNLYIDEFVSLDSQSNDFIQIADLFTSSINRLLNVKSDGKHPKDIFANTFLKTFGITIQDGIIVEIGDLSTKFEL